MTECWQEGRLRAWLDRELPPEEAARAAAHVESCARCGAAYAEVAERAERVAGLMETLDVAEGFVAVRGLKPTQARIRLRTDKLPLPLALAVAATVAIAFLLMPKRMEPPRAENREAPQVYMALDNEPVDAGVVVRVALGPGEVPADVIFDSRGHARAIRLVRQP